jgi:hypothetical protein
MLKSKKVFLLTILVAAIWATIGYQVYHGMSKPAALPRVKTARKVVNTEKSRDDYPLLLAYRDPFGQARRKVLETENKKPVLRPVVTSPPVSSALIQWSNVEYFGSFYNASRKTTTASLRISGQEHIGKEGDVVADLKIIKILRDSVLVQFGTQSKYILKK